MVITEGEKLNNQFSITRILFEQKVSSWWFNN